jgi:hypothetical protein
MARARRRDRRVVARVAHDTRRVESTGAPTRWMRWSHVVETMGFEPTTLCLQTVPPVAVRPSMSSSLGVPRGQ